MKPSNELGNWKKRVETKIGQLLRILMRALAESLCLNIAYLPAHYSAVQHYYLIHAISLPVWL